METISEPVRLPESWPFLAPSQEWRTGWDGTCTRERVGGLPDRHEVTITYRNSKNQQLSTQAVLDFALHRQRDWMVETSPAKARRAQVDTAGRTTSPRRPGQETSCWHGTESRYHLST